MILWTFENDRTLLLLFCDLSSNANDTEIASEVWSIKEKSIILEPLEDNSNGKFLSSFEENVMDTIIYWKWDFGHMVIISNRY